MQDDREEIHRVFDSIAHEAFPDNADVRWHIWDIAQKGGFYCVEAEPLPATVGYPRFRFVLGYAKGDALQDHGCYCLDRGRWLLLYTTPDTSDEWRTLKFDGAA